MQNNKVAYKNTLIILKHQLRLQHSRQNHKKRPASYWTVRRTKNRTKPAGRTQPSNPKGQGREQWRELYQIKDKANKAKNQQKVKDATSNIKTSLHAQRLVPIRLFPHLHVQHYTYTVKNTSVYSVYSVVQSFRNLLPRLLRTRLVYVSFNLSLDFILS